MDENTRLKAIWTDGMDQADRNQWNAMAGPLASPFLEWEWLRCLETSGSVGPGTGWTPHHLLVRSGGQLAGAAALYVKDHSEGEFVFDFPFAELAARMNLDHYPKLVGMTPFTPAGEYRLLTRPGEDEAALMRFMLDEIEREVLALGLTGCQFNFADPGLKDLAENAGYTSWLHQSYVWKPGGISNFDDFLAGLRSGPRRNIRRERAALASQGIRVRMIPGRDLDGDALERMYAFYEATNDKFGPWSCKFLTPEFFGCAATLCRDRLVLASATAPGCEAPLGMALFVVKGGRLYGRYWGGRDVPLLHFETCFYAPMQWAMENNLESFDPGMGSEHKARRGFIAVPNYSLHRPAHPVMRQIMREFQGRINEAEQAMIDELNELLPYVRGRRTGPEPAPRRTDDE